MYIEEFNLMEGVQLPYPNRPTSSTPFGLAGFPYPGYIESDPFAPRGAAFTLSAVPAFTVTSPIIPASMMTPTTACGEGIAEPYYSLGSTPTTAYLTAQPTQPAPIVPTPPNGGGDLRNVLEPILLADLLLGL